MSTNHTPNYALSQWEAGDQVQRADFNADNAKIDEVLKAHADALAGTGNCSVESYLVHDSNTGYTPQNPLKIQFKSTPAFYFVFGGGRFLFGVGGANDAYVVSNGGTRMDMSGTTVSWSGDQVTFMYDSISFSFRLHYVVAFYAQ